MPLSRVGRLQMVEYPMREDCAAPRLDSDCPRLLHRRYCSCSLRGLASTPDLHRRPQVLLVWLLLRVRGSHLRSLPQGGTSFAVYGARTAPLQSTCPSPASVTQTQGASASYGTWG